MKFVFESLKGTMILDDLARQLTLNGKEIYLTRTEYYLLTELVKNRGRVLGYDELLSKIWGDYCVGTKGYLHDFISKLRRKIENNPSLPQHIINVRGFGYRFDIMTLATRDESKK